MESCFPPETEAVRLPKRQASPRMVKLSANRLGLKSCGGRYLLSRSRVSCSARSMNTADVQPKIGAALGGLSPDSGL